MVCFYSRNKKRAKLNVCSYLLLGWKSLVQVKFTVSSLFLPHGQNKMYSSITLMAEKSSFGGLAGIW